MIGLAIKNVSAYVESVAWLGLRNQQWPAHRRVDTMPEIGYGPDSLPPFSNVTTGSQQSAKVDPSLMEVDNLLVKNRHSLLGF